MRFPMALSDIPKTPDAASAVTRLGPDRADVSTLRSDMNATSTAS